MRFLPLFFAIYQKQFVKHFWTWPENKKKLEEKEPKKKEENVDVRSDSKLRESERTFAKSRTENKMMLSSSNSKNRVKEWVLNGIAHERSEKKEKNFEGKNHTDK